MSDFDRDDCWGESSFQILITTRIFVLLKIMDECLIPCSTIDSTQHLLPFTIFTRDILEKNGEFFSHLE